jgi:hypothetical protein
MATRVDDRSRSFVTTPMRRFAESGMRMHKGKDGHVRQLCGPGIVPILQGRIKKVHVQHATKGNIESGEEEAGGA